MKQNIEIMHFYTLTPTLSHREREFL